MSFLAYLATVGTHILIVLSSKLAIYLTPVLRCAYCSRLVAQLSCTLSPDEDLSVRACSVKRMAVETLLKERVAHVQQCEEAYIPSGCTGDLTTTLEHPWSVSPGPETKH